MKVNQHLSSVHSDLVGVNDSLHRIASSLERLVGVAERTEAAIKMPLVYVARVFRGGQQ